MIHSFNSLSDGNGPLNWFVKALKAQRIDVPYRMKGNESFLK